MGAARASATAVAAVVLGVTAVLLVVTWSASIGPGAVLTGEGLATHRVTPTPTPTDSVSGSIGRPPDPRRRERSDAQPVVGAVLLVLALGLVAGVALGVGLILRRLVAEVLARRRPALHPQALPFPVLDPGDRVRHELAEDADEQRAALLEGSPRNAVVACWHRFELQAADAGLSRRPSETSAEFTLRALDLVQADPGAVLRFAEIYREARFSDHPLDEDTRAAAVAALEEIHAGLRAGLAGSPAPDTGGPR
jgi:hypothetical protein